MAGYRNKYDVYDIEKGEFILKSVNSGEIEKAIGLLSTKVSTYATKEYLFNKRYRVIPKTHQSQEVEIVRTKEIQALMEEWDRVIKKPELWHTIKTELLGECGAKFKGGQEEAEAVS